MLTIRPFRNEDSPRLLDLWKKSQIQGSRPRLIPLTINTLQMQVLGIPFFDPKSIMLAFDGDVPVGYVHTTFGPNAEGADQTHRSGQICFLAVDPGFSEAPTAARALITAAERYLIDRGAEEIFGGSPRPCAPFYIGFHGAAEAIGFFDSQTEAIRAFLETGYEVFKTTVRFRLNLAQYKPPVIPTTLDWLDKLEVMINDLPLAKTWWEACSMANFEWIEAVARLKGNGRPVARVKIRIANPDSENADAIYQGCWDAGLIDIRIHPDFYRQGVAAYTLRELLRFLVDKSHVMQIEAHIADDSSTMYPLLRSLHWEEIDTGKIFRKSINGK